MMRNTPPADEFPPQQPPVTTRGDLAVGLLQKKGCCGTDAPQQPFIFSTPI
jgi:hypothetical protein